MENIYVELTREFNDSRPTAILSSGQAVALHRVAIMSKDGDWIVREDAEATAHVLGVLGRRAARYRFGAPLDVRWLRGGWSSHFEFHQGQLRVRTDFVSRPPQVSSGRLAALWVEQGGTDLPLVPVADLVEIKKTNRERDYAVIGELARLLDDPTAQMLASRSARDLEALAAEHPDLVRKLTPRRALLGRLGEGVEATETALDAERRQLIRANEQRLAMYIAAADRWAASWPAVARRIEGLPLAEAHRIVVAKAEGVLPFAVATAAAGVP